MNRRDFAKIAALGAASGTTGMRTAKLQAQSAGGPKIAANDRINVGLIGARNIGGKTHLPSLVGSPQCQLVAICDVDKTVLDSAIQNAEKQYSESARQSSYKGVDAYGDFRELLQRQDVDAVLIATPDHWHVPISKAAIMAGKDVYVEKPLTLHIAEGQELIDLMKTHPAILQVGSQQRSGDRFIIASEFVQNGLLGDIHHVDVSIRTRSGSAETWEKQPVPSELNYDMWLGPVQWMDYHSERVHYNFRFMPEISAGEIANWGAHFLDTAQMGLGTDDTGPISVRGMGERNPVGSLHTSFFDIDVDFEYASGITLKLKSGQNGVTFYGSRGQLYVDRGELKTTPSNLIREYKKDLPITLRKTKGGHLANWFSCIRSRRSEDLHAPVHVGHRSANLCHLANIAIELGRPLEWDPVRESFKQDGHANAMVSRPARKEWRI